MNREMKNGKRKAWALSCGLLLVAGAARADGLRIENVTVAPRDAKTAAVKFDISWGNSWRHGSFHDAAWVVFKVQAGDKSPWQHVRLVADKVVNPTGYGQQKGGTPLEFVVPAGDDGFVGMFVRRAGEGKGPVAAKGGTAAWDLTASKDIPKHLKGASIRAFGIEMVYVAEGPFYLGSGGTELNAFYEYAEGGEQRRPYLVTGAGPLATGRQKGKLWAAGIAPQDNGQVPASFPNGYAAFYCMKFPHITKAQYAGFLNTLTGPEAKGRYYPGYHGTAIKRSGQFPNYTYAASGPDGRCRWLSWADGAAYAAWAGLRPMTELEYEKAIRGPQDPDPRYDATPSYWGVSDVNQGEMERPISAGSAAGRKFAGTHGPPGASSRARTAEAQRPCPPIGRRTFLVPPCFAAKRRLDGTTPSTTCSRRAASRRSPSTCSADPTSAGAPHARRRRGIRPWYLSLAGLTPGSCGALGGCPVPRAPTLS